LLWTRLLGSSLVLLGLGSVALSCFYEVAPPNRIQPVVWIERGATWRYLDDGQGRPDWETLGFDDSAWSEGAAELGYGDCDEVTIVESNCPPGDCPVDPENPWQACDAQFITTYFRHRFSIDGAATIQRAEVHVIRDDGIAIYLNGVEILRDNLPLGALASSTPATAPVAMEAESVFITASVSPDLFVQGENVIAAEVHQEGPGTDISFDLRLLGEAARP
jgi:hypothetical protein